MSRFKIRSGLQLPVEVSFPANPAEGMVAFVDGVMHIYATYLGMQSWIPLTRTKNMYVHQQVVANDVWTINHGLNSKDVSVTFYNDLNEAFEPANEFSQQDGEGVWQYVGEMGEPVTGYAVVFGDSDLSLASLSADTLDVTTTLTVGGDTVLTTVDRDVLIGLINNANTDVVDTLLSTSTTDALSANQGRVLSEMVEAITNVLNTDTASLDTLQEIVDFININRDTLNALTTASIAGLDTQLAVINTSISNIETSIANMNTVLAGKLDVTGKAADSTLFDGRPVTDFVLASDTIDMGTY